MSQRLHRKGPTPNDHAPLMTSLPRLQIVDASSSSKPDNYRVSPASASALNLVSRSFESVWEDWSGRGGTHVDFLPAEALPLTEGRFLGHGVMGGVYETVISGHAFAWKRRFCRRKISDAERKEIEILKKLSHPHIVQLVGTYTHRQFLGLLLHPVAVCDLATFFDDCEANQRELESAPRRRFRQLGIDPDPWGNFRSAVSGYIYSRIGCLTSAVEYLHCQKIRHKDLKPSNILLSADGLWLTDFGTATDFSLLSASATENGERGTPKYFAPEVAEYAPSGRSADMFSLGCILLEICTIMAYFQLKPLRDLRPALDKSFQANLHMINNWFSIFSKPPPQSQHLLLEIRSMLSKDPKQRPSAAESRIHISHLDYFATGNRVSLFGNCCKTWTIPISEHKEEMATLRNNFQGEIQALKEELRRKHLEDTAKHLKKEEQLQSEIEKLKDDNMKLKANPLLRPRISELGNDNEALWRDWATETPQADIDKLKRIYAAGKNPIEDDEYYETNGWLKLEERLEKTAHGGFHKPLAPRRRNAIPHRPDWE
ncbi:kinase-like protein [Melanomma pulvis-pyrius CBS 109.77]|uniref:Kinase-like protein n=1 Tax=Melanomma pulvis-pyrius CBS 109.77 TaxID=1314802 RepID=A0A6A6XKW4_9PLEO|nr:kinase-like protein [Melanomma pulvis-pyrius CBS 109.77]